MIIFEKDGNCRVPSFEALEKDAKWKIVHLKKTYYLQITAKTDIFNGEFIVELDQSGDQMIMHSDRIKIECTKMIGN